MKKLLKISVKASTFLKWEGYDVDKVRHCMTLPDFSLMACENAKERKIERVTKSLPYVVYNPKGYDISLSPY